MQKIKLLTVSILAALVICSAIQISAAQDTPTTPPGVASSTHSPKHGPPVEGDQSAPGVGDLAPIYEHDGQPAFGVNEPDSNASTSGLDSSVPMTTGEQPQLYGANGQEAQDNTATVDNTSLYITIGGAVAAIAVGGAIGVVYYRKTKN